MQELIYTNAVADALLSIVERLSPKGVFAIIDENVAAAYPDLDLGVEATIIPIAGGDDNKTIAAASKVWDALAAHGASRQSLVVNIGGGMTTDLGGFAAATFKRGVRFVNVPTTVLGAVDAAVGGKTGVNHAGIKNSVGVFREADAVVISTAFLASLPQRELLSGYAEMLKHALLTSAEMLWRLYDFPIAEARATDELLPLLKESVEVKRRIVAVDPLEKGLRKTLNLGHTAGHAIEELALLRGEPVPHGYAVAWGLVVSAVLSRMRLDFPSADLMKLASYVERHYGRPQIKCEDYDQLIALMRNDKKNVDADSINFTLLERPGAPVIDRIVSADDIRVALDIARDLLHC